MTELRKAPDTRYCPACARTVPGSQMRVHVGKGEYQEMDRCKACHCTSRIASTRAQGAAHQGGKANG